MEGRKWEDLEEDCLVNVLAKVGMESLLFDIPFVCKSWYKATLNPLCWERILIPKEVLSFPKRCLDTFRVKDFTYDALFRFIAEHRSHGNCIDLDLQYIFFNSLELTRCFTDKFPSLRRLCLSSRDFSSATLSVDMVRKLKHLEDLRLGTPRGLEQITAEINLNCKNFASLTICSMGFRITKEEALSIVTNLPKIKYLDLCCTSFDRECLVMILQGCKDLVYFEFSNCSGFELDDNILELASHINTFRCHEVSLCDHRSWFLDFLYDS